MRVVLASYVYRSQNFTLERDGRFLRASLKRPYRVLSNCHVNGGLREDLTHICNHQSSEGAGHGSRHALISGLGLTAYHYQACEEAEIPGATTVLMSTAANMQCAVRAGAEHGDLRVQVAATTGMLGNATRAGDPAGWHETAQGNHRIDRIASETRSESPIEEGVAKGTDLCPSTPSPQAPSLRSGQTLSRRERNFGDTLTERGGEDYGGTIVTMAFINRPCTPACLVRAATMVTEGKSVAGLDLRMPSLKSPGLATGTGTDQLAVAAPPARGEGDWERHWAGGHNSLGELLGRATRDAVRRCLLLQNGVCAELRRSVCSALARHGCDQEALRGCARTELSSDEAALFERNLLALIHNPRVRPPPIAWPKVSI